MVLRALQWRQPHPRALCKRRHWSSTGLLLLVALHFGVAWLGPRLPLASRGPGCAAQGSATVESSLAQDVAGILGTLGANSAATDKVQEWCQEQGAASFTELLENVDSLIQAADLGPAPAAMLRRSLCAKASAEGSLLPQVAFLHSPALKPAVQRISELLAEEGGNQKFNTLVDVVLEQLAVGRLDWQQISSSIPSLAADAPAAEVALQLLTLGNNLAEEVNVTSSNGRSVSGLLRGSVVSLSFGRSPADQNWGQWASFFVEDGPPLLLGHRLVAGKRSSGDPLFDQATGEPSLQADDTLYFAMPDRAALLELATYDQLPEFATQLAELLKQGADESTGVIAPPDMVSAAKFVNEIEGLSDLEKAERRFRRFESSQPVRRLASAMDTPWTPVLEAAAPRMNELYQAIRKAMLAARPATSVEPRRVSVIRISLVGAVGLLIILGALIFGIWQFLKPTSEVGQTENLPLYTLQSSEAPPSTK